MRVAGWVHRRRDHGGLIFIDLRDRTGIVQLVFHPETAPEAHALAERLRPEHVVSAAGTVVRREEGNVNPKLDDRRDRARRSPRPRRWPRPRRRRSRSTRRRRSTSCCACATASSTCAAPGMQHAMTVRHTVNRAIRDYLNAHDFLEMETPIMTRSTPEGARDFLVPSRLSPGDFYALPQSPQLFKQMLMMAGYERYYQIARCFRDEDLRADRQPEFTQLDMEMSFVERGGRDRDRRGDARARLRGDRLPGRAAAVAADDGSTRRWRATAPTSPTCASGSRSPTSARRWPSTEFRVFAGVLGGGGVVRGLNAGARELSRKDLDGLTEYVQRYGAGGLVWAFVEEDGSWRSPDREGALRRRARGDRARG